MSDGFPNKPKILRGAFVEFGLSLPPLVVVFQFNPLQLTRNRSLTYSAPNKEKREQLNKAEGRQRSEAESFSLREFHQREEYKDLNRLQKDQQVSIQEETINFDIRLDATDDLNEGNPIVGRFGILPRLAALELMVHPKNESLLGKKFLPDFKIRGYSFTKSDNPPMILFIWGYTRVLPVNITSMNITETEFNTILSPIRATATVSLTVIEGKNVPYTFSKGLKEEISALHLANIIEVVNVVIPG